MGKAKDIVLRPIPAKDANELVKRVHYSGKVVQNSQLHIGVFYDGKLEGAMQFGPSLDKRKIQGLVSGTQWHEFIELNRMAFSDALPRNSESRALGIAMKLLKKHAPQVKWVVSFADATQCGDGTIYRASGFVLTDIRQNTKIFNLPNGDVVNKFTYDKAQYAMAAQGKANGRVHMDRMSAKLAPGYQLRYIYFIDPAYRQRLTVPVLPYSEIDRLGAGMYKGVKRASEVNEVTPGSQSGEGGASPTQTLT